MTLMVCQLISLLPNRGMLLWQLIHREVYVTCHQVILVRQVTLRAAIVHIWYCADTRYVLVLVRI